MRLLIAACAVLVAHPVATAAGARDPEDAAEEAMEASQQAAEDASEEAQNTVEEAAEEAAEAAETAADQAADATDDAADAAADASDNAADDAASDPVDAAEDDSDDPADLADEDSDDAQDPQDDPGDDPDESDDDAPDRTRAIDAPGAKSEASTAGQSRSARGRTATDQFAVEMDEDGYEVVAGEVLALLTDPRKLDELRALGLTVAVRDELPGLGLNLVSIKVLPGQAASLLSKLKGAASSAVFARNHLFAAGSIEENRSTRRSTSRRDRPRQGVVGLIDGGVTSSSLDGKVSVRSSRFGGQLPSATQHGSAVAAVLADAGVKSLFAADIFSGRRATSSALIRALDWMAQNKVPVINISLAGPPNDIVRQAVTVLASRGHMIVAAVGNGGPAAPPLYPAAYPEVVAVTAVDRSGAVYRRANRGPHVQFSAEGVGISVAQASGTSTLVSGTSFAAPIVSASIARLLTRPDRHLRERALAATVRKARDLGPKGRDPIYGFGLIGIDD